MEVLISEHQRCIPSILGGLVKNLNNFELKLCIMEPFAPLMSVPQAEVFIAAIEKGLHDKTETSFLVSNSNPVKISLLLVHVLTFIERTYDLIKVRIDALQSVLIQRVKKIL